MHAGVAWIEGLVGVMLGAKAGLGVPLGGNDRCNAFQKYFVSQDSEMLHITGHQPKPRTNTAS